MLNNNQRHYLSGLGLKAEEKEWMGKCENVIAFFPGKGQLEQNFAVLTWEEHFEHHVFSRACITQKIEEQKV